jgi:hypothetical protein
MAKVIRMWIDFSTIRNNGHGRNSSPREISDIDDIALISWSDLDKIKDRFHKKTENQLSKREIYTRLRYNPDKSSRYRSC